MAVIAVCDSLTVVFFVAFLIVKQCTADSGTAQCLRHMTVDSDGILSTFERGFIIALTEIVGSQIVVGKGILRSAAVYCSMALA